MRGGCRATLREWTEEDDQCAEPRHSQNEKKVLDAIREENGIASAEIVRRTGVNKGTVSATLDRLERKGLVNAPTTERGRFAYLKDPETGTLDLAEAS